MPPALEAFQRPPRRLIIVVGLRPRKPCRGIRSGGSTWLAVAERSNQRIDLFLVRSLAPRVDARAGGVADPKDDLVRPRRVVDQHGRRVECVEVPALVERPVQQVYRGAGGPNLGVTRNN